MSGAAEVTAINGPTPGRALAARLGPVGAWSFSLQTQPARVSQSAVADLEAMGYGAIWIPESVGSKEVFSHSALLLAGSERIIVEIGMMISLSNGDRSSITSASQDPLAANSPEIL